MRETILTKDSTGLAIIDVQKKLLNVMPHREEIVRNIRILIRLSQLFQLPMVVTEQYARMLGGTTEELTDDMTSHNPVGKMEFNRCDVSAFNDRIESMCIRNIILTGIETHICVFQTCLSLLDRGYSIHVPVDAVGSRTDQNRLVGLELMNKAGAVITSTETIVFQVLKRAGTGEFKEMLKLIK